LRIGIYGGTFNPPHIGHVRSSEAAALSLGLDLLIVVPSGTPPHKPLPDGTPPADMRLYMTRSAFADTRNTIVSDIEARKTAASFTIDTVGSIKQDYPGAEIFLLVGTDMFQSLETWKDANELIRAVTPAVFSRGPEDLERIGGCARALYARRGVRTEIMHNDVVDISSSELRFMLPLREGLRYITDTNYSYIIQYRLYGAKPDWDWLRAKAYAMLDPKRVPHVIGCETEALRLAERWEVDADDAREAAILHDITKKLGVEDNIRILEEYGIPVGKLEHAEEKLLHAKTGAVLAKGLFGVSDAVAEAIMWHTTGRADMSALEKVIYLADYIEPTRDFDGVEKLRTMAYSNLDDALREGLDMSVMDMKARGITPNQTTFDALASLHS